MSRSIRDRHRTLLAKETVLNKMGRFGQISVCLASPSRYHTGMSSLGFQTVYSLLAGSDGIRCERAFLPDRDEAAEYRRSGTPLLSLESSTPLSDFDAVAFSTSFEPDYLNIPVMLGMARIPLLSSMRSQSDPLILAGGAAFFINPEPVAELIDVICIGEGEDVIPDIVAILLSAVEGGRHGLLRALARVAGVYVPAFYHPRYRSGIFAGYDAEEGAPLPVMRQPVCLDMHKPSSSKIMTEQTEFGDMYLVEVSRGCPRGCRFCSSGFIYGTFRQQSYESVVAAINEGLDHRSRIGLVGAAVSDYAGIGRLCRHIVEQGARVSVSSLRIDRIDAEMLEALIASGHKTISLAPEGGSQRMRDVIRKNLSESQILSACETLVGRDILNLKLYFIIGLPGERDEDLDEMVRLIEAIRSRVIERGRANGRLGEITVSVNPFVPKPFTPFQWCGMEPVSSLERKFKRLDSSLRRLSNVRMKVESLRESYIQALLSRGDRRLTPLLIEMAAGTNLKKAAKTCKIDIDHYVQRTIGGEEILPWCVIDTADQAMLRREHDLALHSTGAPA